jgi:nitrite reductase/ring-hydroxylating ferredoxin subunit
MMRVIIFFLSTLVTIAAFSSVSTRFAGARSRQLSMKKEVTKKEEWVTVLKSKDIAAGDLVPVEVDGLAILIAADLDGKIFAIANSCPHLGTPLENGRLGERSTIVCPLHKSAFSLQTGEVVGDWCPFPPILGPLILGKKYIYIFDKK